MGGRDPFPLGFRFPQNPPRLTGARRGATRPTSGSDPGNTLGVELDDGMSVLPILFSTVGSMELLWLTMLSVMVVSRLEDETSWEFEVAGESAEPVSDDIISAIIPNRRR